MKANSTRRPDPPSVPSELGRLAPRTRRRPTMLADCAPILKALRATDGDAAAAARRLGLTHQQLLYRIHARPELKSCCAELEQTREARLRRDTLRLIKKHHGNLVAASREAGVTHATFFARVKTRGLLPRAHALRPQPPDRSEEKRQLLDAIRRHHGQIYRIGPDLNISKNTVRARMVKHGLVAEADALRAEYNLSGTRNALPIGRDFERRRAEMLRLIESCGGKLSDANKILGISSATFYKNLRILQIDPRRARNEHRLHQIIDALRKSRGVLCQAALTMGCTEGTLRRWCVEFDVEPKDYR